MGEYRSPEITPLSEDKRIKRINPVYVVLGIWFFFLILAVVLLKKNIRHPFPNMLRRRLFPSSSKTTWHRFII